MFSVLLSCLCASIEKGWNFKLEKATLKSFLVFANDVIRMYISELDLIPVSNLYKNVHCSVIIGRNPIEANANTGAIQLHTGKSISPYLEIL